MIALVASVFLASLMGSLHCVGMCGAFVAFAVGLDAPATPRRRAQLQAAYHAGRLATYTTLGAVGGALGAAFDLAGQAAGLQRTALALAGAVMIVFGTWTLLRAAGVRLSAPPLPKALQDRVAASLRFAAQKPPLARAALAGLATTLLPCGWLYAFVVTAAGTGNPALGALVMSVFWLGTLPALVALGTGVQMMLGRLIGAGRAVPILLSGLVIAVGVLNVLDRGRLDAAALGAFARAASADGAAAPLAGSELPCCHDSDLPR